MRQRMIITVVCVLGVAGAFLALTVLKGKSQALASFTYLGTVTNFAGRCGRFSISNCCDAPIHYIPSLVQFTSNGIVYSVHPGEAGLRLLFVPEPRARRAWG